MESLPLIAMFLFSNLLIKANIYFVILFSIYAPRLNALFVWAFFSLSLSLSPRLCLLHYVYQWCALRAKTNGNMM